ncbi:hypothetical protein FIBSPDRAFT_1045724 [Athelia psychrophila]|uniref:Uncharacterized protein n=1 Tax=Athelia psychrophila TaxID=1759441 RepID=A0A166HRY4_9AGAM|nr:hypothetical protein FIBSPDRAFT_1045724 [Fibularhizoctonia sp. CBS 109695]
MSSGSFASPSTANPSAHQTPNTFEVNAVDHEYTVCHRHRPLASVLTPMAPVTIVIACQPVLTYSI